MNADVQFDNETAVKKNVEEATDENFNGTTKMEIELPQNSSQEIESNETNITDTTSNDLPTKTADISESEPTNIYQEEVEEIIVAERITEPKIEPTPEASGNDYKKNDDHAIEPTPTAKPTPTTKPESDEEVASVNGRVNVHQTGPSDVSKYEEPPIEKPVGKISSIDKYKQNYMKKADAPMSGNSTPNSEVTMTPPGTMSLRERMKMFEKKGNPDRIHPRETVTQSERASNIRNKISLWGKSDSGGNSLANQREKIHVGSIDERRNQYSTLAKI